jgi:hypothetical protein
VWGIALYLPFSEGREKRDDLEMHDNSKAFCFWSGRLMPYCKLPTLLPWMEPNKKDKDKANADVLDRVTVLLFFGQVSQRNERFATQCHSITHRPPSNIS